jgi:hypothetical protein
MINLWTILLIFIQPVVWFSLFRVYFQARKRIDFERAQYNTAIYANKFEVKHFIVSALVLGIIGSSISVIIGVYLPVYWILIYELLVLCNLILIPGQFLSLTTILLSTLVLLIAQHFNWLSNIKWDGIDLTLTNPSNYLLLFTLVLFLLGIYVRFLGGKYNSPKIYKNQRGINVAGYLNKEFTIAPLLILIPGGQIHRLISFWPIFSIHDYQFTFFLLPILLGFRMTIFKSMPRLFFRQLGIKLMWISAIGVVFLIVNYFIPQFAIYLIAILWIIYLLMFFKIRQSDHNGSWFNETIDGIRIIAVRPNTPADKMGITIGDVIVSVNGKTVNTEDEFYKALLISPTFCRLKLYNRAGRIKIEETAIYSDAPNELGIVLLTKN